MSTKINREKYFLLRRKKRIKLKELANHIGCSEALISLFETHKSNMSSDKVEKYKNYINSK